MRNAERGTLSGIQRSALESCLMYIGRDYGLTFFGRFTLPLPLIFTLFAMTSPRTCELLSTVTVRLFAMRMPLKILPPVTIAVPLPRTLKST